nr:MAG TPA: hypothetical protein [Caudoviricetes sp.]
MVEHSSKYITKCFLLYPFYHTYSQKLGVI